MLSNIHMHTNFCDGGEEPLKYVESALEKGLVSIGFSAHAPAPFDCNWAVPEHRLKDYIESILNLREKYQSKLQIYLGLELDYFPDMVSYSQKLVQSGPFDYFIGSVHFIDHFPDGKRWTIDGPNDEFRKGFREIFKDDAVTVTRKFFEYNRKMIAELRPPVIGHIDKLKMQYRSDCFIREDHPVFREELLKTLAFAKENNTIVEINTRGFYKNKDTGFYPGIDVFKTMHQMGVKVMVNSDAHLPREILGSFDKAFAELRNAGYTHHYIMNNHKFEAVEIPLTFTL